MQINRTRALRGPNLWTRSTAIEAIVHCDDSELLYTAMPGFEEKLRARFPTIGTLQPHGAAQQLSLAGGKRPDTPALLAAIATAWALDITPDLIGAGIKTFEYQA